MSLIKNSPCYEIKSYRGSGEYGAENPTVLTFTKKPKTISFMFYYDYDEGKYVCTHLELYINALSTSYKRYCYLYHTAYNPDAIIELYIKRSEDGKTITYYNVETDIKQFNKPSHEYYYKVDY